MRDCDAVWLCLDAGELANDSGRLQRQQEIEQLIEECLDQSAQAVLDRPVAVVLTKSDLLDLDEASLKQAFPSRVITWRASP